MSGTGRPIRVLWLIKGLGPGGAERLLVEAATVRDRDAFEYEAAYLLPWKDTLVAELETLGVPVQCLEASNEYDVRWARRLRRLLVEHSIDVLHVHSPNSAAIARVVNRTLGRGARARVVSTEHNDWSTFRMGSRVINGLTLPLSDAATVVSDAVRRSVWRPLRRRTETVVHGVSVPRVRAARPDRDAVRRELDAQTGEVLVGTVANYTRKKDFPNLLHAARQLADRTVPVRFVVVGQGPLENEVRALRDQLGLADRVQLMGHQPNAVRVMAGCDLFTLASRVEGLPVSVMEALVLGLPVVATEVGGIPEAVRDGVEGVLVPPGRPEVLAAAIEELATDEDRRLQLGRAATARGERFDISRAMETYEGVYRSLVRR